jgi:alpha-D-xyloside xylohydrolase
MADWAKCTSSLMDFAKGQHDPIVRASAAEVDGAAVTLRLTTRAGKEAYGRMEFCGDSIVRLRISDSAITPRETPMVIKNEWPSRNALADVTGDAVVLRSAALAVRMTRDPRRLSIEDATGEVLLTEDLHDRRSLGTAWVSYPLGFVASEGRTHLTATFESSPEEQFYGFGEKFGPLSKRGRSVQSFNQGAGTWVEGSHKNVPFFMSSRGYGLFFNTSFPMQFDMGVRSNATHSFTVAEGLLDLYFIYGPSFKDILSRYTELTGRPEMPPTWSLGIWMSRFTYTSSKEVEEVAARMRQERLPCDVIKIDTGWFHREGRGSVCDFDMEWNRETWPRPEEFMANLRRMGYRTALFVDPHVMTDSPTAQEARRLGHLVMMPDGSERSWSMGPGCTMVAFDLTSEPARQWYKGKLKELLKQGASTFFADWGVDSPPEARYAGMEGLAHNNVYGLLYNRTVHEAVREHTGEPAVIWGVSGYAGSQRYPTTYGGDSRCTFRDMASVLRGGLSAAMSGILFYGCDIGGYGHALDRNPDETLYIRYLQHGFFLPFAQFHGMGPREPWHYGPRAVEVYRKYARLRYRLLPYVLSQSYQACRCGIPVLRPMVLEFQDDPTCAHLDLQYMFGDSFLVAPIFGPETHRRVYLPAGTWWDYWTGKPLTGPAWIEVDAPLETLPLFVRAGSIIPMGPQVDYTDQIMQGTLTLDVYPRPGDFATVVLCGTREQRVEASLDGQWLRMWAPQLGEPVIIHVHGVTAVSVEAHGAPLPMVAASDIADGVEGYCPVDEGLRILARLGEAGDLVIRRE